MSPKTAPPLPTGFTDPKLAAAALAIGGKLLRVEDAGGRLLFHIGDIPADFELRVVNDQVQVSVRAMLTSMEQILGLIAQAKRRRDSR